ncbi:membrane protein [Muricoccus aerilatus]|uniref:membrane protein n=1 Tax=Muricoccus aerilatus TaxID=452982 RepID=UPI0005C189F8|nr:membrane protein [Roseomonas aerilata]
MVRSLSSIDLAPILPYWLLAALAVLAVLALLPAIIRRARGAWWRALAFLLILGAIANPRLVQQTREMRPDIALLAVDNSASTTVAGRDAAIEKARAAIEARAGRLPDLELRTVTAEEGGSQGTRLFAAIERGLADIPRARLAGVIALTDGQVHDVPRDLPIEAPLHVLLPGRAGEVDRRLRIIEAPGFGIVGRGVELRLVVEDLGVPAGNAAPLRLTIRRDGGAPRTESVQPGREQRIAVPIERGGPSVIEITAEERPGEVSTLNNTAIVTVNGVRDRLRVLLVSGEPHAGERTWRRLLKADPNVDLVHFTILRPPEKDDLTPLNELALIAFPVRELFQQKLREFDLIVFDRFSNRGILPPQYLRNIAEHVRQGGALLLSVGPEFTGRESLANTPLGAVLPARPLPGNQALLEAPFRAQVSDAGLRHPVTEGLTGANATTADAASWGRWYRMLRAEPRGGSTVMNGPDGNPLLQLDRVGEGRVALLLSDQIWLWSRGHNGGGPQAELLRRIAHWLMREPELEEEDLTASIAQGRLTVTRRSLADAPPPEITVTAPDGTRTRHTPERREGGRAVVELPATRAGVWSATDGARTAFAAAEAANPPEVADLRADPARMQPLLVSSGGTARWMGDGTALPDLRRVSTGRDASGPGWIGLVRREDHTVTGISALPLLPPWLALLLVLGVAVIAWRREGR